MGSHRLGKGAVFASAILAAAALLFSAIPASADDTGNIIITVTDAATHAPLGLARVLLDGPVITNELSGQDGKVSFTDVPSGIYRARVGKNGYSQVTSAQFEVLEGRQVTVTVELVKPAVKTIGSITVRSSATISESSVNDSTAVRKLSDTLADALGKLSGVSVATDPSGSSDSQVTISLEGHDPSQTSLTLDGVPLNAPGVAGDLQSINTDLFSAGSANFGPNAGSLGGSVNFTSIQPTLSWQGKFTTSVGSFGKAATIVSASGTAGAVGIAFTHSIRGGDNPITGLEYLDTSGLDYIHNGAAQSGGDLFKIRTPLGADQTLSATYVSTNNYNNLVCTLFTGPLPCGYGPGNYSDRHYSLATLTDTALAGMVALQFSLFGGTSTFNRDLLDRYVAGIPAPFGTVSDSRTSGASLNATLPSRERHTISFQATTTDAKLTTIGVISTSSPFSNSSSTSNYSTISMSDKIHSSSTLTLGARLGMSFSPQTSNSVIGGASAVYTPTAWDSVTGSVDIGGAGVGLSRIFPLSDPASLRFDCNAGNGYGAGPGDSPGPTSSTSERLTWQHRFKTGQFSAQLYSQVQNDVLLNTYVNGSVLPPGYLPPGYLAAAQLVYQSSGGCGTALPFGPTNLYINQPVANVQRLYQGLQLTGGFRVGNGLAVEPYYDIQKAVANTSDPRLTDPYSFVISGAQSAGVPLQRGGLTLDYKAPHSAIEWLANGTYVSGNNAQNLPGYVTADAGVAINFNKGTLTLAGTNLFNKYGYYFASPANAVPQETVGGELVPTVARPLSPRQYSVTYTVRFGNVRQSSYTPPLLADAGAGPSGTRGGGGPNGVPGGGFAALPPLANTPPEHPLDPDTTRQACTADAAKSVKPFLEQVKAYVAAVEAAKGADGYPASAPANAPAVDGVNIAYHKTPTSFALVFTPTKAGSLRNFLACVSLHLGTADEAKALGLYVPPTSAFSRLPLVYSPEGGLYVVRQPQVAGREQFRLYKLPTTPPAQPFALASGTSCTDELKPAAQTLLGALQTYFTGFDPASPPAAPPAGWTVTTHKTAAGYWSELQLDDISRIPAVLNCGHVATGTPDEVKAAKLDGARPPTLNYSPKFGIYLIRPADQGTGTPRPQ